MPSSHPRDRAILHPGRARERIDVGRVEPPPALAPYVDYGWWVRWVAPEGHRQATVPRPVVHVVAEPVGEPDAQELRVVVHGVRRTLFERHLVGEGLAVAVGFRAACFRPFLGRDVVVLRDREVPASELFDVDDRALARRALACDDPDDGVGVLLGWLSALAPSGPPDHRAVVVGELVERVEHDASITRAEQLADLAGVGLRTLQRWFLAHVGVGPKWVVQRFRLLDVVGAAHSGEPVDWAALAVELGYADQSHLVRAFSALVGHPPAAYAGGA